MDPSRIATICHLYYSELWPELAHSLRSLPARSRLLITLPADRLAGVEECVRKEFPRAEFHPLPNKGRDIVPFLRVLPDLAGEGVELVCKIHTKKGSPEYGCRWREHGRIWREMMLDSMLASPEWVEKVVADFHGNPNLGMLGPDRLFASAAVNLYENHPNIEALWRRLPFEKNLPKDWGFFAGSMFWSRLEPLLPLARAIQHFQIEEENDQNDGQTAHALERMFGLMIREAGLSVGLVDVRRLRSEPAKALRLTKPPHRVIERPVHRVLEEIEKNGEHLPLAPTGLCDKLLRELQRPFRRIITTSRRAESGKRKRKSKLKPSRGQTRSDPMRKTAEACEKTETGWGFREYWRRSTLLPMLRAPYSEENEYVIRCFDTFRRARLAHCQAIESEEPLVSVILPTYNRGYCLGRAIESVLAQTWNNWELWIIDDGSSDDTSHVVQGYQDSRIHFHRLKRNAGQAVARNLALARASGSFVCYLDSDNTFHPCFLQIMARELEGSTRFDVVYCAQKIWLDLGKADCREMGIRFGAFHRGLMENRNAIDLGAVMHRRELLERHGVFDESMRGVEDWEFLLRLSTDKTFLPVPCILCNYRHAAQHGRQVSNSADMGKAYGQLDGHLKRRSLKEHLGGRVGDEELGRMFGPLSRVEVSDPRRVGVIIPSYECLSQLRLAVESVDAFTPTERVQLIIVDNASGPDVQSYLDDLERAGRAMVLRNPANLGFTHAVNRGLDALPEDWDALLLNNDAVVTHHWLDGLQEVLQRHPETGLVVPRQVLAPGAPTLPLHCPEADPNREVDVNISHHHDNLIDPCFDMELGLMSLRFAPFFCVYIPRHTLNEVGPLDIENGPHYDSDGLYCDAVTTLTGRRIVYTPRSKVYHSFQQATGRLKERDPLLYDKMFVRNDWKEIRRHGRENPDAVGQKVAAGKE